MKSRLSLSNNISALSNSKNEYYDVTSDEIGNITSYDGLNYTWVGRQLKSVSQVGNPSVGATYSYNSDGQRIGKNITLDDGETYDYDYYYNGNILAGYRLVITDEEGQASTHIVTFMYDENGEAFGFNYNGNDYYYVRNAQSDVIFISNSDNTGVVMYQYDAWGNMTACYDTSDDGMLSIVNPYTYRGYYYEFETNTYFLKSRYYNPELCRFISSDDSDTLFYTPDDVTDKNLFAYCDNNPISRADTDGYLWNVIVGAMVGAGIEIASQIFTGKSLSTINWKKVGISALSGGLTAAVGPVAGCLISGATDLAMEMVDGNVKGVNDAVKVFAKGTARAVVCYGVGTAIGKVTKSLSKIEKVGRIGKNGYPGIKYSYNKGKGRAVRSIEIHPRHNGHGVHLQGNKWNPKTGTRSGTFFRKTLWR